MQVSVETIGTLGRRLKVAVPADQVEKEFNDRLQRLSKQVKLPGFRPGKGPLKMVGAPYGGGYGGGGAAPGRRPACAAKDGTPGGAARVHRRVRDLSGSKTLRSRGRAYRA